MDNSPPAGLPIACALTPEQLSQRQATLLPGLLSRASAITPTEHGYVLSYTPEPGLVEAIASCIALERQCCPFLRFALLVTSEAIQFEVNGPTGTRAFLDALFTPASV